MATKRIRILHLIDSYRIGGPGKTIINSARFIDTGRYEILVSSFVPQDETVNEFGRAVVQAGIPYHGIRETGRLNWSHGRELADLVRRERIDILHTHGYKPDILGAFLRPGLPETTLVTTHHGWIENRWRQTAFIRLAIALSRRFHGVVCVARHLLDRLPRSVRESSRSTLIHNAIVTEDYRPAGLRGSIRAGHGIGDDEVLIGVVGRLSVEKGCEEALEAFRLLDGESRRCRLAFIGEGPLEGLLRELAVAAGLDRRVLFPGHQTPVQPWLESIDILLNPSRTEGLANVLLEAQAFGKPVVATRVGGNHEIVTDGVNGLLVEPGNPGLQRNAVSRILNEPGLGASLGGAGIRNVEENFSFETRMRRMEAFYGTIRAAARTGR